MYAQLGIESIVGQRREASLVTTNMGLCYLKWCCHFFTYHITSVFKGLRVSMTTVF